MPRRLASCVVESRPRVLDEGGIRKSQKSKSFHPYQYQSARFEDWKLESLKT